MTFPGSHGQQMEEQASELWTMDSKPSQRPPTPHLTESHLKETTLPPKGKSRVSESCLLPTSSVLGLPRPSEAFSQHCKRAGVPGAGREATPGEQGS